MSDQAPDRSYIRLLMVLLGTATFFEGYDTGIAAVVIPDLARDFHISNGLLGGPIAVVNLGAMFALFVIAIGDRVGRRPLLIATTLLYALFTGATAAAHSVAMFTAIQFLARTFLVSELAIAITIATEEFPADRRGRMIGGLSLLGAFGLVAVVVAYRFVAHTSLGWRGLYLLGAIPLLVAAPLRTRLRESRRWVAAKARGERLRGIPVRRVLAGAYRGRLLIVSGMLYCFNFAVLSGAAYWTLFARNERGLPADTANAYLAAAVVLGLPGYIVAGWLQDRWGRRRTGTLFFLTGAACGAAAFQVHGRVPMLVALTGAVFFGLGGSPVVNAVSSELFPTGIRATALAVARSFFGTLGASSGLLLVPRLASHHGLIGSYGNAVALAGLALIPASVLLNRLPETAGRELEDLEVEETQAKPAVPRRKRRLRQGWRRLLEEELEHQGIGRVRAWGVFQPNVPVTGGWSIGIVVHAVAWAVGRRRGGIAHRTLWAITDTSLHVYIMQTRLIPGFFKIRKPAGAWDLDEVRCLWIRPGRFSASSVSLRIQAGSRYIEVKSLVWDSFTHAVVRLLCDEETVVGTLPPVV